MARWKSQERLFAHSPEIIVYLAGTFLVFTRIGGHWSEHWFTKWAALMGLASITLSWIVASRTSLAFLPGLLIGTLSGVWVSGWAFNGYSEQFNVAFVEGLGRDAWYGYIALCFSGLAVAFFPAKLAASVEKSLAGMCVVSVLWTIFQYDQTPFERVAFSGNASMNGCLIAVLFPYLWERVRHREWTVAPLVLAVYLTGASIPLGVVAVVLITLLVARMKFGWKQFVTAVVIVGIIGAIGWLEMGETLFKDSSRFDNWKQFMAWWGEHSSPWFGAGLGTSLHLISYLNLRAGQTDNVYLWFHSEYLQTLFELGYVGLASMLLAAAVIFKRSLGRPHLTAAFLGYCAAGVFNYPLRLPVHALGLVLTIALIMQTGARRRA